MTPAIYGRSVPIKVDEMIKLLECEGWRHVEAENRIEHPEAGRPAEGAAVKGYVVVFEGDDASGFSAYSPDLPGVVAAGDTRAETEKLIREALTEHVALLRESGQPVPEPTASAGATVISIPAA